MANLLHTNGKFVTVHSNCWKISQTTSDLRMRVGKCIEVNGGISEHLLRTANKNLSKNIKSKLK